MSTVAIKRESQNTPAPKEPADRIFLMAADALAIDDFDGWNDKWILVRGMSLYISTASGMFLSVDDKVDKKDKEKHRKIDRGDEKPSGLSTAKPSDSVATYFWEALQAFKRRRLEERIAPMERRALAANPSPPSSKPREDGV